MDRIIDLEERGIQGDPAHETAQRSPVIGGNRKARIGQSVTQRLNDQSAQPQVRRRIKRHDQ